jgi:hypothetical protein
LAAFHCAKNASFLRGAVLLWMKALGRASSPDASFLNGSFIANYKIARSPALSAAFFSVPRSHAVRASGSFSSLNTQVHAARTNHVIKRSCFAVLTI